MNKFYILVWLKWIIRVSLYSALMASIFIFFYLIVLYFYKDLSITNSDVILALSDIFKFWFPIVWSMTLLLSLFISLKYIFNVCNGKYSFRLLSCSGLEEIDPVGYGDLIKVFRKFLMLIVWLSAIFVIIIFVFMKTIEGINSLFDWFNIYWLYSIILISGYFSFILLPLRSKNVKVKKC